MICYIREGARKNRSAVVDILPIKSYKKGLRF
jgi:hypothetical protein